MLNEPVTRRSLLLSAAGLALAGSMRPWPLHAAGQQTLQEFEIAAAPARAALLGGDSPGTEVWAYSGSVPGPEIRVRQGDRLRVVIQNRLGEETTIHWHGLRVPNLMDGVPHLTQKPIAPGETFTYEFDVPDAGTYWYHPHQRSFEQVGRGLYAPLIVEERDPIPVHRDVTWVLDDWRLMPDASIADGFGNLMEMSMSGRIGNTISINGKTPGPFKARSGERIRLRLINAANARIFGLTFQGHQPRIIALDGQPVTPHEAANGRIVIGPAMRIDLLLDMTGGPGQTFAIRDTFYPTLAYTLRDIVYAGEPPLREGPHEPFASLPANTMPEPDLAGAERHEVVLGGGMNSGMTGAMMGGRPADMREMMHAGKMWAINGVTASGHVMEPLLTLERGRSYVLALHNRTAWNHPVHLHGHSFRVIARDGRPTRYREWQDTVLMAPHEKVDIAFVADNPGDWMIHCHILEHQAGGMMGVIRVA